MGLGGILDVKQIFGSWILGKDSEPRVREGLQRRAPTGSKKWSVLRILKRSPERLENKGCPNGCLGYISEINLNYKGLYIAGYIGYTGNIAII